MTPELEAAVRNLLAAETEYQALDRALVEYAGLSAVEYSARLDALASSDLAVHAAIAALQREVAGEADGTAE